jgi:hypothetical protein
MGHLTPEDRERIVAEVVNHTASTRRWLLLGALASLAAAVVLFTFKSDRLADVARDADVWEGQKDILFSNNVLVQAGQHV